MTREHELKTWPDVFQVIVDGDKVHEYRKDDRDFRKGDILRLREFVPAGERYTGRQVSAIVTHVDKGPTWGIAEGYAVMSIRLFGGSSV